MKNKDLKRRIIDISYKNKLSHIGSCITAVDIIEYIYQQKKSDEKFVLSSGHAHLAHAVVMEKRGIIKDAEDSIKTHGIHCERPAGCDASTGSLGHGLGIAVGMALADRNKNVYCLISDGECSEGSIWEALRIAYEQKLMNLKIYLNLNGWGAYKEIEKGFLSRRLNEWNIDLMWGKADRLINFRYTSFELPFLEGQSAHYMVMNEEQYKEAMTILS